MPSTISFRHRFQCFFRYQKRRVSTGGTHAGRKIVEVDEAAAEMDLRVRWCFKQASMVKTAAWNRIEGCFENVEVGKRCWDRVEAL